MRDWRRSSPNYETKGLTGLKAAAVVAEDEAHSPRLALKVAISHKRGTPNTPPNTTILIIGTPKKVPPIFGSPQVQETNLKCSSAVLPRMGQCWCRQGHAHAGTHRKRWAGGTSGAMAASSKRHVHKRPHLCPRTSSSPGSNCI